MCWTHLPIRSFTPPAFVPHHHVMSNDFLLWRGVIVSSVPCSAAISEGLLPRAPDDTFISYREEGDCFPLPISLCIRGSNQVNRSVLGVCTHSPMTGLQRAHDTSHNFYCCTPQYLDKSSSWQKSVRLLLWRKVKKNGKPLRVCWQSTIPHRISTAEYLPALQLRLSFGLLLAPFFWLVYLLFFFPFPDRRHLFQEWACVCHYRWNKFKQPKSRNRLCSQTSTAEN